MPEPLQLTSEYDFSIAERFNVKFLKTEKVTPHNKVIPTC